MMPAEITVLLLLVLGHLSGDFILQRSSWIDERYEKHGRSKRLYIHAGSHTALAFIILWLLLPTSWCLLFFALIIGGTHFLIDLTKSYLDRYQIIWFLLDQLAHLLIITAVWLTISNQWELIDRLVGIAMQEKSLIIVIAYFMVIWPFAIAISFICRSWAVEMQEMGSLPNAGKRIGQLERFLILTFILVGQFAAIGFLLAAKSVLRFGDGGEAHHRKINEYVLVGTMTSFSITIAFGLLVNILIAGL